MKKFDVIKIDVEYNTTEVIFSGLEWEEAQDEAYHLGVVALPGVYYDVVDTSPKDEQ